MKKTLPRKRRRRLYHALEDYMYHALEEDSTDEEDYHALEDPTDEEDYHALEEEDSTSRGRFLLLYMYVTMFFLWCMWVRPGMRPG